MFFIGVIIVRRLLFIRITEKGMKFSEQITAGFKEAFIFGGKHICKND